MNLGNAFSKSAIVGAAMMTSFQNASADPAVPGTYADHVVDANASNVYYEVFYGNEVTGVVLDGYCPTPAYDIDLWVYDSGNNLVGRSTSNGCYEEVYVQPIWTDTFKIVVENQGKPRRTVYDLTTF